MRELFYTLRWTRPAYLSRPYMHRSWVRFLQRMGLIQSTTGTADMGSHRKNMRTQSGNTMNTIRAFKTVCLLRLLFSPLPPRSLPFSLFSALLPWAQVLRSSKHEGPLAPVSPSHGFPSPFFPQLRRLWRFLCGGFLPLLLEAFGTTEGEKFLAFVSIFSFFVFSFLFLVLIVCEVLFRLAIRLWIWFERAMRAWEFGDPLSK